ncbi:MAG: hypothetical protein V4642_03630 [Bacteroidota bacterium]
MKAKILFPALIVAVGMLASGCEDKNNPTDPVDQDAGRNVITNSGFDTENTMVRDLDYVSAKPWITATGSPQIGAGYGSHTTTRGFMQMWGDNSSSESIMQTLVTPIVKGKKYSLTAMGKVMIESSTVNLNYAVVEFYAFNEQISYAQWQPVSNKVALIGAVTLRNLDWQKQTIPDWIADNNYTGIAVQVRSNEDSHVTRKVSWGHIDDVELRVK